MRDFKSELIEHLKTKLISNIDSLWGETKSYYKARLIEMGGCYASFGEDISVWLLIDKEQQMSLKFSVSLDEVVKFTSLVDKMKPLQKLENQRTFVRDVMAEYADEHHEFVVKRIMEGLRISWDEAFSLFDNEHLSRYFSPEKKN